MDNNDIPGPPMPESRFTQPRQDCQHPEHWHSTDWHSTEIEVSEMIGGLIRGIQPEMCIETGTGYAQTTIAIEQALKRNGHGYLITFETDLERVKYAMDRVDKAIVRVIHGPARAFTPNKAINFAFFDSDPVVRVIECIHFTKWMPSGSIVAFHDTAPGRSYDLHKEIRSKLSPYLRLIRLPTPRGITLGEVI